MGLRQHLNFYSDCFGPKAQAPEAWRVRGKRGLSSVTVPTLWVTQVTVETQHPLPRVIWESRSGG